MNLFLMLLLAAPQDLATEWIDRVSHDAEVAKGPLPVRPLQHVLYLGVLAAYDTNVNLEETNEDANSVVVPFLRLRLDYSERQLDAALDVVANWNQYIPDHEQSNDEERVYGRIRYVSPKVQLQAAEILQHVSDPVDVVFADRVDRFVSQTVGNARYEPTAAFALEADVDLGILRYQEKDFDDGDNWNLRAGLGAAVRLSSVMEAVARAGVLTVDYRYESGAPPDVDGLWARAGITGDLLPQLSVTALLGVVQAESEDFESGADGVDEETGEAAVMLRWQPSETWTLYGDYTRMLTFGGAPEPFAVVNRWMARAEYDLSADVQLRARMQFDHADGALGIEREYASAGAGVRWKSHPQVYFDAGVTARWGDASDGGTLDTEYDDVVVHFGMFVTN